MTRLDEVKRILAEYVEELKPSRVERDACALALIETVAGIAKESGMAAEQMGGRSKLHIGFEDGPSVKLCAFRGEVGVVKFDEPEVSKGLVPLRYDRAQKRLTGKDMTQTGEYESAEVVVARDLVKRLKEEPQTAPPGDPRW